MPPIRRNLILGLAVGTAVLITFFTAWRHPFLAIEDGYIESASAAGFGMAALLFALRTAHRRETAGRRRLFVALSALSLLFLLDEISFGARLFGFEMPQMSGGGEFDGAHDLVIVFARRLDTAGTAGWLLAITAVLLLATLAACLAGAYADIVRRWGRQCLTRPLPFRLVSAAAALFGATLLDLSDAGPAAILEEVLELAASGLLVLAALSGSSVSFRLRRLPLIAARLRQSPRRWSGRRPAGTDARNP